MKRQAHRPFLSLILLFLFATLACTIPGTGIGWPQESWPEPTPETDVISFNVPNYNVTLQASGSVPGTFMRYLNPSGGNYEVSIDGLRAIKRAGDSFIWRGVVAQAVFAEYNLRLGSSARPTELPVQGQVVVYVLNPQPQMVRELPPQAANAVNYPRISIDYTVPPGYTIPGTDLTYEGISQSVLGVPQGRLSGLTEYPLLAQGDAFFWTGKLRDNVYLRYNLETIALDERGIRLTGEAELWVWRMSFDEARRQFQ